MRSLLVFLSLVYCLNQGSAYIYPLCSKDDESCMSFFDITGFTGISLPSFGFGHVEEEESLPEPHVEEPIESLEDLDHWLWLTSLNNYYQENILPIVIYVYEITKPYIKEVHRQLIPVLKYVPFLKYEEKVKADGRLYLLFIATSVGIYLILYIYFTKKLFNYYQSNLRRQYLINVKKIFKTKE